MKKITKKTKSVRTNNKGINLPPEKIVELCLPTPEEEYFTYQLSASHLLHFLDLTKTAKDFYSQLSEVILVSDKLTQAEREYLANLVKEPYKPKRGAGIKEQRYHEIYQDFIFLLHIEEVPDTEKIRRVDAIKIIMEKYKVTADAAGKSYDIARKHHGDAPPPKKARAKSGNK